MSFIQRIPFSQQLTNMVEMQPNHLLLREMVAKIQSFIQDAPFFDTALESIFRYTTAEAGLEIALNRGQVERDPESEVVPLGTVYMKPVEGLETDKYGWKPLMRMMSGLAPHRNWPDMPRYVQALSEKIESLLGRIQNERGSLNFQAELDQLKPFAQTVVENWNRFALESQAMNQSWREPPLDGPIPQRHNGIGQGRNCSGVCIIQ